MEKAGHLGKGRRVARDRGEFIRRWKRHVQSGETQLSTQQPAKSTAVAAARRADKRAITGAFREGRRAAPGPLGAPLIKGA